MDRFYTVPMATLPLGRLELQRGRFIVGTRNWLMPQAVQLARDPENRLALTADGRTFTLGPVTRCSADTVNPFYEFVADPGDQVTFTRSHSLLSWPTPYYNIVFNVPQGTWRRNTYYTMIWKKASGASLQITWPDAQAFYTAVGWTECYQIGRAHV